ILWDRLFGTFVEEDDVDRPVYGTRSPLRSWNPLWANAEVYWAAAVDAWHAKRWRDKLQLWFRRPGWRPADVAARFPKPAYDIGRAVYNPPMPPALAGYCLLQFALLLGMATHPLLLGRWFGVAHLDGYAAVAIAVLFGASTLVLPWMAGLRPREALRHEAVAG